MGFSKSSDVSREGSLNHLTGRKQSALWMRVQIKEPDLHPALSGDEVYTPSPRRSEG